MLNKFLCWMWGHQFNQVNFLYDYFNEYCEYVTNYDQCKRCGVRK